MGLCKVLKMGSIPTALTTSTTGLTEAMDEMRGALQNAAETFSDFKAGFAQNGNMRKSFLRLEEAVGGFAQQTDAATGMLRDAVSDATDTLLGTANSVSLACDSIAKVGDQIATAWHNIDRSIALLLAGNTAHAARMDAIGLSLGEIVKTTSRNQQEWSDAILPTIRAMTETAGKLEISIAPLNTRTEAFAEATEQVERAIAESSESQQAFIAKTSAVLTAGGVIHRWND